MGRRVGASVCIPLASFHKHDYYVFLAGILLLVVG